MIYDNGMRFDEDEDNELWDDDLGLMSDSDDSVYQNNHNESEESEDYYSEQSHEEQDDYSLSKIRHDDYSIDTEHEGDEKDYYSEPVDRSPHKSRRERFFGKTDEEEEGDFYDSDVEAEPEPIRKPKVPKLDPEDPDYWIEEESAISSILPKTRKKWKWWLAAIIMLLVAITGIWIWFFRPYVDDAVKYGYIKNMERRGALIKTFEGSMIPYKEIGDPNPLQFEEVSFSVQSDSLAALMKRMMLDCMPVRLEYEVYHSSLPWKGESKMIIIKADQADPNKILPPEFR